MIREILSAVNNGSGDKEIDMKSIEKSKDLKIRDSMKALLMLFIVNIGGPTAKLIVFCVGLILTIIILEHFGVLEMFK